MSMIGPVSVVVAGMCVGSVSPGAAAARLCGRRNVPLPVQGSIEERTERRQQDHQHGPQCPLGPLDLPYGNIRERPPDGDHQEYGDKGYNREHHPEFDGFHGELLFASECVTAVNPWRVMPARGCL